MDFSRNNAPTPQTVRPVAHTQVAVDADNGGGKKHRMKQTLGTWTRLGYAVLLFAATILIVAMAALIAFGGGNESKYIMSSKYQAVFLNDGSTNGQSVYFGHITSLTDKYIVLQDIYYITTSSSSSSTTSSNYTLTKLGCQQLHDPYDQMIINTDQVAFWENLQNSGKVVQTIDQFQQQNPNGPNCSQTSTSSTSTGTTQNAGSATTPSTSSTK